MKNNEYLYEWICPQRKGEYTRVMLVGDFFMYEARLALEEQLPFVLDAVGGNIPLASRLEHLERLLAQRRYTAVVVGESCRHGNVADTACLPQLVAAYPQIRFIVATAAASFLTKGRYRTPAEALVERNASARRTAEELGLPCLDLAAAAASLGAGSFSAYLWNSAASLVLPGRRFRRLNALRRELIAVTRRFLTDALPCGEASLLPAGCSLDSSIRWKNRYFVPASECLCIGDSNMYRFRLSSAKLRRHADVYASTLSPLWEETQQDLRGMLRPEHRTVVLSLGVHHLDECSRPDFRERCCALISFLQANSRKVVAVGVSPFACADDISVPDELRNAAICRQNSAFRTVAEEVEIEFVDVYAMLEHEPHSDPAHFKRGSYAAPARAIAALCVY